MLLSGPGAVARARLCVRWWRFVRWFGGRRLAVYQSQQLQLAPGPTQLQLAPGPTQLQLPPGAWRNRVGDLTAAERQIVELLADGRSPKQAALDLHVSLATVRSWISAAKRKTGARTLPELVALSVLAGLDDLNRSAVWEPLEQRSAERPQLTARQLEVVVLLADGHRVGGIAEILHVSASAVHRRMEAARARAGVSSTAALVVWAINEGLVSTGRTASDTRPGLRDGS